MNAVSRTRLADPIDPLDIPDNALLPPTARGTTLNAVGRVNTPASVARWMAKEAFAALPKPQSSRPTILEPAAGSGVIVAALIEALAAGRKTSEITNATRHVWSIDTDEQIRPAAEARLRTMFNTSTANALRSNYRIGDALLDDTLIPHEPIDVIIGNPPFLGARDAKRLDAFEQWHDRFGFCGDLYAYFMLRSMQLVRDGGIVCLLVPDTWLRLSGYEHLRRRILEGRLLKIVRLPGNTFAKHVMPCFFVWQKSTPSRNKTLYIDLRDQRISNITPTMAKPKSMKIAQSAYVSAPRAIIYEPTRENQRSAALHTAATERSLPRLAEYLHINDAGIHSRNCRHRLFFQRRERAGLKRLLQGRQIEPFAVRWDSPKARYRWVDIAYQPQPGVKGRRGNGTPSVRDEYWDWQGDPAIHRLPQRILIRQTGDRIIAARCVQKRTHHYTDNTLFSAVPTQTARDIGIDERFFVAYLNSETASRIYRFLSGETGRPQAQIKITLLRELPFIVPERGEIQSMERIVERLEAAGENGEEVAALRREIDAFFGRLFDLSLPAMLAD